MQNNEITNLVRDSIVQESERVGKTVFRGLLEDLPVARLPESVFVNYFLPKFAGVDQTRTENWTLEWVSVAGTPMAEVSVFRDGTGEELFRVPPLLHSNGLVLHKEEGDIGDIFARYNQINQNVPQSALMFLVEALHTKNKEYLAALNNSEVVQRWVDILTRYGYASQPGGSEAGGGVEKTQDLRDMFDL